MSSCQDEREILMDKMISQMVNDQREGIERILQANPYSSFEWYNYRMLKNRPELFESTFYCESTQSKIEKEELCRRLEEPNGKNTFFLVGYQGCGKSTFIHSVINKYMQTTKTRVAVLDCDKIGNDKKQVNKVVCMQLKEAIRLSGDFAGFVDFYRGNYWTINRFNDPIYSEFYSYIEKMNEENYKISFCPGDDFDKLTNFIDSRLSVKQALFLLVLWMLAQDFGDTNSIKKKLILFVDNLDGIDDYEELSEFVSCIDAMTVEFSGKFDEFVLCRDLPEERDSFVSKIKVFIAMRETTKANLPGSHFSNAFSSIYTNKDMTEWFDKGEIIKKRISVIQQYDKKGRICEPQKTQLKLIDEITNDIYTQNVIYSMFNNNYRSAVSMICHVVVSHTNRFNDEYTSLMHYDKRPQYRHGARGILYKYIFDEFNTGKETKTSYFRRIGVLDLSNRKNNAVSICRLLLSYLSNYTETICDSGLNSISLKEVRNAFKDIFSEDDVNKILHEMFALRDSKWSHLVSFNEMKFIDSGQRIDSQVDFNKCDPECTTIHYSCAGKVYIEYITTHFEFFTVRVFKDQREALFCKSNLRAINNNRKEYGCYEIIKRVFEEVKNCCESLKEFNREICRLNNYPDPYAENPIPYRDSHYVCQFKRDRNEKSEERRFHQFHEERIILTHINYIDCYRMYVLNDCNEIENDVRPFFNKKITGFIKDYVNLLSSDSVLKSKNVVEKIIPHYKDRIRTLEKNWNDFSTEIVINN